MHDRLDKRLRWMETDSPYAHACPDLYLLIREQQKLMDAQIQAQLRALEIRRARNTQRIGLYEFGGSGRLNEYLAQLGDA